MAPGDDGLRHQDVVVRVATRVAYPFAERCRVDLKRFRLGVRLVQTLGQLIRSYHRLTAAAAPRSRTSTP